uniref:hypothetical protein n=1 Tax=Agathobacter sp. TaxID=2021311 RepID=UPI003FED6630
MNARGFFKQIVAVTLAGLMVFGSAMVTMADADSNNTQNVATDSEQTNAQGYKPGQVYTGDQNEFDAKGEALPGYHWDYKKLTDYVEGYYDTKQDPICKKTEHEHSTYDGACYTKNTCDLAEHEHSAYGGECYTQRTCNLEEHKHGIKCFNWKLERVCGKEEHKHSTDKDGCKGYDLTCTKNVHTHSTEENGCTGPVRTCGKEAHTHGDRCYPYVQPILATYEFQMKADENTTNGNEKISITVHVACENGKDAKNVQVTIKAHDRNPFAETRDLERTGTTNLSGNVEFKISATYDKITSVEVNGSIVDGYGKEIGLSNKHINLSYTVAHEYEESEGTAVKSTMNSKGEIIVGHGNDLVCKYCGDKKDGEKKTVENVSCYLCEDPDYVIPAPGKHASNSKFKKICDTTLTITENENGEGVISFDTEAVRAQAIAGLEDSENTTVVFRRFQYEAADAAKGRNGWHADYQIVKTTQAPEYDSLTYIIKNGESIIFSKTIENGVVIEKGTATKAEDADAKLWAAYTDDINSAIQGLADTTQIAFSELQGEAGNYYVEYVITAKPTPDPTPT